MSKADEEILDHVSCFHDTGLYIPTRTIKLESALNDEDGEEHGVGYSMSSKFLKNLAILESLGQDPINVILSTGGGDVWEGLAIYDAIRRAKSPISIKVYGKAMSMGSIILQAGDERVLSPHSMVVCHSGLTSGITANPYESKNFVEFDFKVGALADKILLDRINEKREAMNQAPMAKHTFESMLLKGKYMTAQEAVDLGLADRIDDDE